MEIVNKDAANSIREATAELRQQILVHPLYSAINNISDLRLFMQSHVYAVWDFMSLLKSLQNQLTCTRVPWFPQGDAATRYLINEIVTGEESDLDLMGKRKSHFEMYLDAMEQTGADGKPILEFCRILSSIGDRQMAYAKANTPKEARLFVDFTFEVINSDKSHVQAAVFTFGREDLIPGMFHTFVNELQAQMPERVSMFTYYLNRHIEIDGDHHSNLAIEMTNRLCGNNTQLIREATEAVKTALRLRIDLWNGVLKSLPSYSVSG
jgi:hypothetical protein